MAQSSGTRLNLFRRAALRAGSFLASMGGGVTLNLLEDNGGNWARGNNQLSSAGPVINDDSALAVTTAFACVRTIAETGGSVSGAVYERQANGNAVKVDHEVGDLLFNQPNADMNGVEFIEAGLTNLAARGNGYAIVTRKPSGEARTLLPVRAARCEPKRRETDGSIYYKVNDRGRYEEYPQEKIWHLKGFGYTGLVGLSPISYARQALGLALAGEEAQAKLFANGLAPTALVKIPGWLTTDQRKLAEEKLAKLHQGLTNYGKPYLLEGGMELDDGVFAPKDAQFLELRKMQVPEICRLWRISPHMVADLERATNNNIEQLSLEFIMYTMLPYFRRIERKASDLFKPSDRRKYFVQFNFESLLRADSQARAQLYSILLQNGVFSRNEVRALENRNRVDEEGMDDYTVQSNMALLQLLETMQRSQAKGTQ